MDTTEPGAHRHVKGIDECFAEHQRAQGAMPAPLDTYAGNVTGDPYGVGNVTGATKWVRDPATDRAKRVSVDKPTRTVRDIIRSKLNEAHGRVEHLQALLTKLEKSNAADLTSDELQELTYRT